MEDITLKQAQEEVDIWINQFTLAYFPPLSRLAAMTEEVGELARVLNRIYGPKQAKTDENIKNLEEEIGDLLFTLICMANAEGIDLNQAHTKKMQKVYGRDNERFKEFKK